MKDREETDYEAYNCKRNLQKQRTIYEPGSDSRRLGPQRPWFKAFGFIVLHDGTYFETLQIVYHDTMENFAEISKLNVGAAIIVKGTLVSDTGSKAAV